MKEPYHTALRHHRRSAGLSQLEVARILGVGGRSYISMLESGDRVPTVRDTVILSLLYGSDSSVVFPQVYQSIGELFKSNARKYLEEVLQQSGDSSPESIRYIRNALSDAELQGNVEPLV
jgi:transcriptional regulator with XRE-family HTH domain